MTKGIKRRHILQWFGAGALATNNAIFRRRLA